ncbi:MAG: Ig-like domain-containing protein [Planctomycetes bacterium]|nr:Ig-like domain-containing protein [Planctomycetota bacterium]
MSLRRRPTAASFATALKSLFQSRQARHPRRLGGLSSLERFENRNMLALSVTGIAPLDGSTNVPLNSDLVFTFNENVIKGQGNIYVVRQGTGTTGVAVDVRSANVSVSGNQVTVDLPTDLELDNTYSVYIDKGAFIDTSSTPTTGATLLQQNFDFTPLQPFVTDGGGDGTDWSPNIALGFTVDNSEMPTGGKEEWKGWVAADKNSWIKQAGAPEGQNRDQFTLASGGIMVADTDEFDDAPNGGAFKSYVTTKPVDLTGVAAGSVKLEFDSSFRPEGPGEAQTGKLDVSYDGGTTWSTLLTLNEFNTTNTAGSASFVNKSINERLVSGTSTGVSGDGKGGATFGAVVNPNSGSLVFRFYTEGTNDWWWGVDNMKITGNIVGGEYAGLSDATFWNFTTPESPKLTLAINPGSMSENGGTATATVSRNNLPVGDVLVTLSSSDTTEATVPATVLIPNGQSSVTFPITAVDDNLSDRTQKVTITATSVVYAQSTASINVVDDEGPKVLTLTPADNATGVGYKANFSLTFGTTVKKGSGNIHIVETATGWIGATLDVKSSAVVVSGSTVTIDPPINLKGLTGYSLLIDDGAFLDTSSTLTSNAVLLTETFDRLPLGPFVTEPRGDGTDFTRELPAGFTVDNSQMPASQSDFQGWTFVDKNSWITTAGDQDRSRFSFGTGTVAVADSDEWDDVSHAAGRFNSLLITKSIDLSGITPGTVTLEFDSSYNKELPQYGTVEVSYDDGATWSPLLFFGDAANTNSALNNHITVSASNTAGQYVQGATVDAPLNSPSSGQMKFKFGYFEGDNNWWWAIDNIVVRGEKEGVPYAGIDDTATWSVTTAEAPTLTVTLTPASISENGGVATGTVTRNVAAGTSGALVVALASSDTTAATVPATVTIPDGQSSVTFSISGVDDLLSDGSQTSVITATATDFFSVSATVTVLDDDFPKPTNFSPADNATAVAVSANGVVTYDQAIKKGNGFIYIVRSSDNKAEKMIDINSAEVSISGSTLTINPVRDLVKLTDYYILIDNGAVLSASSFVTSGVQLLKQDFELLPLGPAVYETVGLQGGKEFTATPPGGWTTDNSAMPFGGAPEWRGWTFANKNFWTTEGGQSRANFTLGSGTVAVADTDEWDDYGYYPKNSFNAKLLSTPINLATVAASSVTLEFDSSFRPESGGSFTPYTPDNMQGFLDVSYDAGATWTNLLTLDSSNTLGSSTAANVNEHRTVSVQNPDDGTMVFRWTNTGTNDWWWAIDNIIVKGTVDGLPSPGISSPTTWNFTTADAATLTVTAAAAATEGDAPLTGTVTRNLGTVGDLVVTLASSDTGAATVPATVTIPNGQESVTFPITIVNDARYRGTRPVTFTATAASFVAGTTSVSIADNDVGEVVISEIMYDSSQSGSRDTATEWVELYNRGSSTADVGNWYFDDEDTIKWGAIPAGTTIPAGGVLVLYNNWVGTASEFRAAWNVPATAGVVGLVWGDLDNSPTRVNEMFVLKDASGTTRNTANFAEDGTVWPAYVAGSSHYLKNLTGDTDVGTNWRASVAGTDGALHPTSAVYNAADTGSPGRVGADGTIVDVPSGQTQTDSTVHSGAERIVKQGTGMLVLTGSNTHSGGTVVTAGTLVVKNLAALGSGALEVQAGAKVVLDVGTGTVDITSLVLATGGLLDFGAGKLTAQSGLNRTSILAAINAGKGDGSWNGIAGFTSTVVASTPARTLGWMDNGGSFTVGYAAPGDSNLDGSVDIGDLANFLGSGQLDAGTPADWISGDFNHDGVVDQLDLADLLGASLYDVGNYLPATEAPASASGSSVTPVEAAFAAFAAESQVGTGRKKSAFSLV